MRRHPNAPIVPHTGTAHSKIPLVERISKRKDGVQKWWCNKDLGQIFSRTPNRWIMGFLRRTVITAPLKSFPQRYSAKTQVRPSSATGLQPSRLCDLALWFTGSICSIK